MRHKKTPWFTVIRQRRMAIALAAADFLLLFFWFAGSIFLATVLDDDECLRSSQTGQHFIILIHFALGMFVTMMEGDLTLKLEKAHAKGKQLITLTYAHYKPLTWIFTGLIALFGDISILTWAILDYQIAIPHEPAICRDAQIMHITLDSLALAISTVIVLWFIIFSFWQVHKKRTVAVDDK